jgi:hypothetical protein
LLTGAAGFTTGVPVAEDGLSSAGLAAAPEFDVDWVEDTAVFPVAGVSFVC